MSSDMNDNILGENLRELRHDRGMTQEMVSKELHISRQVYSYYETGQRLPNLEMAGRLAAYYKITLDQLVSTGLRPVQKDPIESTPERFRKLVRLYDKLPANTKKFVIAFLEFLNKESK